MSDDQLVLYTSAEVADLLRLNHQVVQRKLQSGELPGYRIGREWRVSRSQLVDWLEARSNRRTPAGVQAVSPFFDADGRLVTMPAQRAKREAVLQRIVSDLEPDRTYSERQLNRVLRRFHDDVATIRRELVAARLVVRTKDGVYKRSGPREPALRRG